MKFDLDTDQIKEIMEAALTIGSTIASIEGEEEREQLSAFVSYRSVEMFFRAMEGESWAYILNSWGLMSDDTYDAIEYGCEDEEEEDEEEDIDEELLESLQAKQKELEEWAKSLPDDSPFKGQPVAQLMPRKYAKLMK